jgi:hypothetical protein
MANNDSCMGNANRINVIQLTLSPASVANATSAEQTFTMTNLGTADLVYVMKPTAQAGLGIVGSRCSAAGVLAVTFGNFTSATITPTSAETYVVMVIHTYEPYTVL